MLQNDAIAQKHLRKRKNIEIEDENEDEDEGTPLRCFIRQVVEWPDFIGRNAWLRSSGGSLSDRQRSLSRCVRYCTAKAQRRNQKRGINHGWTRINTDSED